MTARSFATPSRRSRRGLPGRDAIVEAQRLLARWGFGLIVIWLPVLGEAVAFLAGLTAMPFRPFLAALTAGALPIGFVFATAGHLGKETPIVVIVFSALLPIAIWLLARRYTRDGGQ